VTPRAVGARRWRVPAVDPGILRILFRCCVPEVCQSVVMAHAVRVRHAHLIRARADERRSHHRVDPNVLARLTAPGRKGDARVAVRANRPRRDVCRNAAGMPIAVSCGARQRLYSTKAAHFVQALISDNGTPFFAGDVPLDVLRPDSISHAAPPWARLGRSRSAGAAAHARRRASQPAQRLPTVPSVRCGRCCASRGGS
jgi:hypothetical protein